MNDYNGSILHYIRITEISQLDTKREVHFWVPQGIRGLDSINSNHPMSISIRKYIYINSYNSFSSKLSNKKEYNFSVHCTVM